MVRQTIAMATPKYRSLSSLLISSTKSISPSISCARSIRWHKYDCLQQGETFLGYPLGASAHLDRTQRHNSLPSATRLRSLHRTTNKVLRGRTKAEKLSRLERDKISGLKPCVPETTSQRARELSEKFDSLVTWPASRGETSESWLFDLPHPTALDAHLTVFIARMLDGWKRQCRSRKVEELCGTSDADG